LVFLIGIGNDGHCGALHPASDAIRCTGEGKVVIALKEGDKAGPGVAVSMDVLRCGKIVVVAANGPGKADGVHTDI